ncbi:unnamed protein product [Prorocentrum cordatum]|uniref:Protein kinase domain-containing protein n=1 Tax=Prorocentrum cordatum TaxID=2364126 RepID=A0ABN9UZZ0_9DINO|nr:unnamed protein product [Polarella glacialis]
MAIDLQVLPAEIRDVNETSRSNQNTQPPHGAPQNGTSGKSDKLLGEFSKTNSPSGMPSFSVVNMLRVHELLCGHLFVNDWSWMGYKFTALARLALWRDSPAQLVNDEEIDAFLDDAMPDMPKIDMPIPSIEKLRGAFKRARRAAPGPDGLPVDAWLPCQRAMDNVFPLMQKMFDGSALIPGLNDSLFAFLPKGLADPGRSDLTDCIRAPGTTRPLSLKNQDINAIATAMNYHMKGVAESSTDPDQQGFIACRNYARHILTMDTEARAVPVPPCVRPLCRDAGPRCKAVEYLLKQKAPALHEPFGTGHVAHERADADATGPGGLTALHLACRDNSAEVVQRYRPAPTPSAHCRAAGRVSKRLPGMASLTGRLKVVEVRGPTGATTRFAVPEPWEAIGPLGAGAYASVAAFRAGRGERCAVKKVERVLGHPVVALRTLREVKLLQHLRHPNILGLHGLHVDGPDFTDTYLCLELMDSDLHKLIHGGPALPSCQAKSIMYQMMLGLLCLRTANVVHRDMKPGNVLVKANGIAKIADFGLARAIDAGEDDSVEEVLTEYVVTRYYRAPEIVLTATSYTYAVDMWSAGCILGEMLTSKTVFRGKDTLDQVRKIVGVIGSQPTEEMDWIPRASPSWKFVQECNSKSTSEAFQKVLHTLGLETDAADLLVQTLRFSPSRRIQVEDAVLHPYLESFSADTDPNVVAALDVPPMDWDFDGDLCFDAHGKPRPYDAGRFRRALLDCCGAGAPLAAGPRSAAAPATAAAAAGSAKLGISAAKDLESPGAAIVRDARRRWGGK